MELIGDLNVEMESDLQYEQFSKNIKQALAAQEEFDHLKELEKKQNQRIKELTEKIKKACDDFAQEAEEKEQQIQELRKKVNETDVEAQLHI